MAEHAPEPKMFLAGAAEALRRAAAVPFPTEQIDIEWIDPEEPASGLRFIWSGLTGWLVRGTVRSHGQGLVIDELAIRRSPDSTGQPGVTSKALRAIPIGFLLQVVRARLSHLKTEDEARAVFGVIRRPEAEMRVVETAVAEGRRRGRRPMDREHFRLVARLYLAELESGKPRGAINRLAARLEEHLGHKVTENTARSWIYRARNEFEFLGPTKQGSPGAEPGPQLDIREDQP